MRGGYDCDLTNGVHFHGLHENTSNPNALSVKKWQKQFSDFSSKLKALYLSTFTKNLTISYKFFTPFALISYVSARVLIKSFSKLGII
jgi:hypothetical protein